MFKSAIVLTFSYALCSIFSSFGAGDISSITAITSILMTTAATELALYFGVA